MTEVGGLEIIYACACLKDRSSHVTNCLLSKTLLLQPMRILVKPAGCNETMEIGSDTVIVALC